MQFDSNTFDQNEINHNAFAAKPSVWMMNDNASTMTDIRNESLMSIIFSGTLDTSTSRRERRREWPQIQQILNRMARNEKYSTKIN